MSEKAKKNKITPKSLLNVTRKLVSKDRYRFKDGEIDLDLAYITDNIIGKSDRKNFD